MNSKIISVLEEKKVKPTPMRMLVLEQFMKNASAQSLSDIEVFLAPSDRITIYRTLKTFVKSGILHAIEDGSGATKYALCTNSCNLLHHEDFHPHFSCLKCNETFCLEDVIVPLPHIDRGFKVKEMNVQLKGLCNSCQKATLTP